MKLLNDIVYLTNVILYITMGVVAVVGLLGFYFLKIKKPKKDHENDAKYSKFDRENSLTYVPIDDIQDNMIIMENGTRFVAAIVCTGFDFYSANIAEQYGANKGYIGFINIIDKPLQKRIYCKAVDLEKNIRDHKKIVADLEKKLVSMYNEGTIIGNNLKTLENENERQLYEEAFTKIYKDIKNTKWQHEHMLHVISYLEQISSGRTEPVREDCYLFDWRFNEKDFPADITDEEIRERAAKELEARTGQFKHALSTCNVKVKRADNTLLREMLRRHYQPYGADIFKENDIDESNYDEPIVSSNSLKEAEEKYNESFKQELIDKLMGAA